MRRLLLIFCFLCSASAYRTFYINPGDVYERVPEDEGFQIFCYTGKPKYIVHLWQTVNIQISVPNDNYEVYEASSSNLVVKEYTEHRSSWRINLFAWKQKQFNLDPFNSSCIGIESTENYSIKLNVIRVDYWKVLRLVLGILLFMYAQRMSRNTLFYYICGITFGICASFLILIYFVSKLFPRKPMMYGVVACGWTVGVYILQLLWENVRVILLSYQTHVAWYAFITGIISFIVCYRMGPVSNKRTLNLIQWTLQLIAMCLIFFSSQFQEAAMGQIVVLLLFHLFPRKWIDKSKSLWQTRFPPKIVPLTNDEYYHQGVKETNKALEDLRAFCSSPECNQWKIVSKLKDSKRFASFIEGQSHLSDQEMLEYEASIVDEDEYTDDEEDNYTDDEY
ncbi:nuclear envelope integral membrane protein [Atheta coriaria]|uniref:nuclear envelope integral membrane protein n=1 Tax=Dalotia coriaria TaxID=877792 RepID=UPI0031F43701